MGTLCTTKATEEFEAFPPYEIACNETEDLLKLSKVEIKDLESALEEAFYHQRTLDFSTLASIFAKFSVPESEFLAPESPFQLFYSGLTGSVEADKDYILSASLPFCKGRVSEKKDVLWRCLETNHKEYISYEDLTQLIEMLIILPTKVIPEIACKGNTENASAEVKTLLECKEEDISRYAQQYFPKLPRERDRMHRHEFDAWLMHGEGQNLFSPTHHRKSLIEYLKKYGSKVQ